jgi:hypothetical protein
MQEIFLRLEASLERELEVLGGASEQKDGDSDGDGRSPSTDAAIAMGIAEDIADEARGVQQTVLRRASAVMLGQMRLNEELFGPAAGGPSSSGGGNGGAAATRAQASAAWNNGWETIVR